MTIPQDLVENIDMADKKVVLVDATLEEQYLNNRYDELDESHAKEISREAFIARGWSPIAAKILDGTRQMRWALVDANNRALTFATTNRMKAFMKRGTDHVENTTIYLIGDVFTPPQSRNKGYCRRLMGQLPYELGVHPVRPESLPAVDMAKLSRGEVFPPGTASVLATHLTESFYPKLYLVSPDLGWKMRPELNQVLTMHPSAFASVDKEASPLRPIYRHELEDVMNHVSKHVRGELESIVVDADQTILCPDPVNLPMTFDRRYTLSPSNPSEGLPSSDIVCGLSLAPAGEPVQDHPFVIIETYRGKTVIMSMHKVDSTNIASIVNGVIQNGTNVKVIQYYGNQSDDLAKAWEACGGEIQRGEEQGIIGHAASWWGEGRYHMKGIEAWATFA